MQEPHTLRPIAATESRQPRRRTPDGRAAARASLMVGGWLILGVVPVRGAWAATGAQDAVPAAGAAATAEPAPDTPVSAEHPPAADERSAPVPVEGAPAADRPAAATDLPADEGRAGADIESLPNPCRNAAVADTHADAHADAQHAPWIDRVERSLHEGSCRSARWIDGLFGVRIDDATPYSRASGSVAPSLLWSEYDGFQPRLRFRVDLPLPNMDRRFRAFVGRFDRDEFVTERAERSGAIPRQFGTIGQEQTLLGLGYSSPLREGGRFDTSAGIRLRTPLDPYLKASYAMGHALGPGTALQIKPTAFWQQSEGVGATLRGDLDHIYDDRWFARYTASSTFSQKSQGVRGYATATLFHKLSDRRAIAGQLGIDGESDAEVSLKEYGARVTYRQQVWRDWLVLELRTSLTWPREKREESRTPSWGAGIGFEMVFGDGVFRGND